MVATATRLLVHPEGSAASAVAVVATVSLVWWSIDEIARGESPFRRVLGAAVLLSIAIGRLTG